MYNNKSSLDHINLYTNIVINIILKNFYGVKGPGRQNIIGLMKVIMQPCEVLVVNMDRVLDGKSSFGSVHGKDRIKSHPIDAKCKRNLGEE